MTAARRKSKETPLKEKKDREDEEGKKRQRKTKDSFLDLPVCRETAAQISTARFPSHKVPLGLHPCTPL